MSVNIQPLAEYVVAQSEAEKKKTASGIILPEAATEKPKTAKVVAIGKKVADVKVGDRIIYKSFSSTEVKVDGQDYILVEQEDILATVK
mgnify:FL=1